MDYKNFYAAATAHIERFYPRVCPVCHQTNWALGQFVSLPVTGAQMSYAFFPYSCQVCGYTYWINATAAGFTYDEIQGYTGEVIKEAPDTNTEEGRNDA